MENNNNNSFFNLLDSLTTNAANRVNSGQTSIFDGLMSVISGANNIATNAQPNQATANSAGGSSSSSNSQSSAANPIANVFQQFSVSVLGMNNVVANALRSVLLHNKINVDNFLAFTTNNNINIENKFDNFVKFRKAVNHNNNVSGMHNAASQYKEKFKINGSNPAFENFIKLSFMAGNNYHLAIVEKLNQMDRSVNVEHIGNVRDFFLNLAKIETPPLFNDPLTPAVVKFYDTLFKIEYLLSYRETDVVEIAKMNFNDFYAEVKFYEEDFHAKVNFDLVDVNNFSANTNIALSEEQRSRSASVDSLD